MQIHILIVTAGIGWLTWYSSRLNGVSQPVAEALRGGLWFLLVSCLIGIAISVIGSLQQAAGLFLEVYGEAGVLKYPHGATIHALQTIPMLAWVVSYFNVPFQVLLIRLSISGHSLLLLHAAGQTLAGRSRLDVDAVSGTLLISAILFIITPVIVFTASKLPNFVGYFTIHK